MIRKFSFLLSLLWPFLISNEGFASDVRKDIEKINRTYKEVKYLSADIQFRFFKNYQAAASSEESLGQFNKTGSQLYYRYENKEYVATDKLALDIDNDNKIMLISNGPLLADRIDHPENVNLDTLLKQCKSVEYKNEGNVSSYFFHFGFSTVDAIKVYFDNKSYLITKLVFYYSKPVADGNTEKPRIEIQYSNFQKKKSGGPRYRLDYYVIPQKGRYKVTSRFKGYKLINMMLTK